MDLDTATLISSLIIGTVGFAVFIYGKKAQNYKCLGIGLGLSVYPIFVHSLLLMWLIAAAGGATLWFLPRGD